MTDPTQTPDNHDTPTDPTQGAPVMFPMTATRNMETVVYHDKSTPHTTVWSARNPDGTHDLWSGDTPLLENCTLEDITHFLQWGHTQCPDETCTLCR